MKYKNIKSFMSALFIALAISMNSCVDDLNVTPIDPSVTQTFDQDQVFTKVYSSLALTGQSAPDGDADVKGVDEGFSAFYRSIWNLNELTTDEALWAWNDTGIPELQYNSWSSSNLLIKGLYGRLYFNVTLCNHFLELTVGKDDEKTKKQRAETRFMRALNYFYLLDMFDNVPFTETVTLKNYAFPIKRTDLFTYVDSELAAIEKDMYQVGETKPYYRVNVVANWLLRSRLFLNSEVYTGTAKWDSAAIYAAKVIDTSSGYSLCPTYRHLFMADNAGAIDGNPLNKAPNEIIFPIAQDGKQTKNWGGSEFLIAATRSGDMPTSGISPSWSCARAREKLVRKFFPVTLPKFYDDNDLTTARLPASFKDSRALFLMGGTKSKLDPTKDSIVLRSLGIINNTFTQGFSVIKFSNLRADGGKASDNVWTDMDIPFMRKAEAYLTYAEAVTRGAAIPSGGTSAIEAINVLRRRAGKTADLTGALSLQNIIDEWAREFFFEGRRRMDLIRFGQYGGTGTGYTWDWKNGVDVGTDFDVKYNIFPIPSTDVNANPNLTTTSGY